MQAPRSPTLPPLPSKREAVVDLREQELRNAAQGLEHAGAVRGLGLEPGNVQPVQLPVHVLDRHRVRKVALVELEDERNRPDVDQYILTLKTSISLFRYWKPCLAQQFGSGVTE